MEKLTLYCVFYILSAQVETFVALKADDLKLPDVQESLNSSYLFFHKHGYPDLNLNNKPASRASPAINSIPMRIDHFSWFNKKTFDMRYSSNGEFWNGTGPMMVIIGGEASIENFLPYLQGGFIYDMAKEFGGYLFMTEHRYYGDSVPNYDLTTVNLRRLKFDQALADISDFITNRQNAISGLQLCQVIVIGGSYAASLAAWARLKYPGQINMAYASSGFTKLRVNNYQFDEVVQKALKNNTQCYNTIKYGIEDIMALMSNSTGAKKLRNDLNLCEPLKYTDPKERQKVFHSLEGPILTSVQYNSTSRPYINNLCSLLTQNSSATYYQSLTNFFSNYVFSVNNCIWSYRYYVGKLKNTGLTEERPWVYQICTQFGELITTDSQDQPFNRTVPISFWYHLCNDVFGMFFGRVRVNLAVGNTNNVYGGANPALTQVVYTVGTTDPWSGTQPTSDVNSLAPVIVIKGASHSQDLLPNVTGDSAELINARIKVKNILYNWLNS